MANLTKISNVIIEDQKENADINILDIYAAKFKMLKMNVKARKMIAKELSIEEQNALKWQTVGDVFSFIDTSSLAKEHPKEASRVLKIVAGIITAVIPASAPITAVVIALPQDKAAQLVEWLGKPTPEHIIHKIAEEKSKKAK